MIKWTEERFYTVVAEELEPDLLIKGLERPQLFKFFDGTGAESIGSFVLAPLPGNCGIVVSTATFIQPSSRGLRLSRILHKLKETIARQLGYSMMLATVVTDNVPEIAGAFKAGWKVQKTFTNERTGNVCYLMVKLL